jgi:hypothetical protein
VSDGSVEPGGFVVKCVEAAVCDVFVGVFVVVAPGAGLDVDAVEPGAVGVPDVDAVVVASDLAALAVEAEQAPTGSMTRADRVNSAARPLIRVTQRP